MLCLQKTKSDSIKKEKCYAIWGDKEIEWIHNDWGNNDGGIINMWRKDSFIYEEYMSSKGYLAVYGKSRREEVSLVVLNVCSSCQLSKKYELWKEKMQLKK